MHVAEASSQHTRLHTSDPWSNTLHSSCMNNQPEDYRIPRTEPDSWLNIPASKQGGGDHIFTLCLHICKKKIKKTLGILIPHKYNVTYEHR